MALHACAGPHDPLQVLQYQQWLLHENTVKVGPNKPAISGQLGAVSSLLHVHVIGIHIIFHANVNKDHAAAVDYLNGWAACKPWPPANFMESWAQTILTVWLAYIYVYWPRAANHMNCSVFLRIFYVLYDSTDLNGKLVISALCFMGWQHSCRPYIPVCSQ